jgi:hypothetical protein
MRTNEDLAFNLMAIEGTDNKKILDETLYLFRHEGNSITRSADKPLSLVSLDYVTALYYAEKYLSEKVGTTNQLLVNIIASYNHYQAGLSLGLQPSDEVKNQLKFLLNRPRVRESLSSISSLEYFMTIPKSYMIYEKQVYYYKQTFYDWLNEFLE